MAKSIQTMMGNTATSDTMTFNDMVKNQRCKNKNINKNADKKEEIIQSVKSSLNLTEFGNLSFLHGDNTYWQDYIKGGTLVYHSMEYRNFMMDQLNTTISVSDDNIHCHISVYLDNEDKGSKDWDMRYNADDSVSTITSELIEEIIYRYEGFLGERY